MSSKNLKKISVIGAGYVGMSIAVLLSQKHCVTIFDIDEVKLKLINDGISPIKDDYISDFLTNRDLNLKTAKNFEHIINSDIFILAVPTNFIEDKNSFDTKTLEDLIKKISKLNKNALIVIKSTIPIGWTKHIQDKYKNENIVFCPEFLREGNALYDNLYPSRIIIGANHYKAKEFGSILKESSLKKDVDIIYTNSTEAESIKLFSNSYLAMRVAFFNEVDSFAISKNIDPKSIISGISLDDRIGDYYNNPSFGYGGYCLPKDTKQLLSNFEGINQSLIDAIVSSNDIRLNYLAEHILSLKFKKIGVYKLEMKKGSDNHRDSAISKLLETIRKKDANVDILIYDPSILLKSLSGIPITNNLDNFRSHSDLVLCNRIPENDDLKGKIIYSRDLYGDN